MRARYSPSSGLPGQVMGRASSITKLPKAVREWLEQALVDGNFTGYQALEALLRERGYDVSKSAIHRHGSKLEQQLSVLKESTEMARVITESLPDDQGSRSDAVIAMVETGMFETLFKMRAANDPNVSDGERLCLLNEAAKSIATLSRASVTLKKFQADVRDKLASKLADLEKESDSGKGRAFDKETLRIVREEIYGIMG